MTKGLVYKHKNNRSVAMQITTSYYVKERDRWSLRVMWYKYSPTRGLEYSMNISQRLTITREQRKGWELLQDV